MAKSKKIDKDMGFRLKKARLDQKLTYDELSENPVFHQDILKRLKIMAMFQVSKNSDSSFVLYTSLPIHFFIQRL